MIAEFASPQWLELFNAASLETFDETPPASAWADALVVGFRFSDLYPATGREFLFFERVASTGHRQLSTSGTPDALSLELTLATFRSWAGVEYRDLVRRRYYADFKVTPEAPLFRYVMGNVDKIFGGACPNWPSFTLEPITAG